MNASPRTIWLACCGLVLLAGGTARTLWAQTQDEAVQEKGSGGKQARFKEFLGKVDQYDQLRNSQRGGSRQWARKRRRSKSGNIKKCWPRRSRKLEKTLSRATFSRRTRRKHFEMRSAARIRETTQKQ